MTVNELTSKSYNNTTEIVKTLQDNNFKWKALPNETTIYVIDETKKRNNSIELGINEQKNGKLKLAIVK